MIVTPSIRELLEKKYNGDKLTDQELMVLIRHLGSVSTLLSEMGMRYFMPFKETQLMYIELYDYARNRKLVQGDYSKENIEEWFRKNS